MTINGKKLHKKTLSILLGLILLMSLVFGTNLEMVSAKPIEQYQGSKLSGINKAIYDKLKKEIYKVAYGERSDTYFSFWGSEVGLRTSWPADMDMLAVDVYWSYDLYAIVDALLVDCPFELYWFDKSNIGGLEYGEFLYQSRWSDGTIYYDKELIFAFSVSTDYSLNGEAHTWQMDVTKTKKAISAMERALSVVEENRNKPDYEKLVAYRDYICQMVEYDYSAIENNADYGDSWQLTGIFDNDPSTNVVCEGYAKAFQLLCDCSEMAGDTYSMLVTGYMDSGRNSGLHMWNVVHLDGQNYLVDVTNCDAQTVNNPNDYFMRGYNLGDEQSGYWIRMSENDNNGIYYGYDMGTLFYRGDILRLSGSDYVPKDKKLPSASQFQCLFPTDLMYDGMSKKVLVTAGAGVVGLGEISVTYRDSENRIVAEPKEIGSYKVFVSVREGLDYLSAKDIEVGEFSIIEDPKVVEERNVLSSIGTTKSSMEIKRGKSKKFPFVSDFNPDKVKSVTYSSTNSKVAKVNKNGEITGKKKGTVTIKAKITLHTGKTKTVKVKVVVKK